MTEPVCVCFFCRIVAPDRSEPGEPLALDDMTDEGRRVVAQIKSFPPGSRDQRVGACSLHRARYLQVKHP